MKPTREEMMKKLGKREPLPGAGKPTGPNWDRQAPESAPSGRSGIGALPADFLRNPRAIQKDREEKAGLKCGGMVKKKAGGMVRGCGVAVKGKSKAKMY
jgi:hypothetical protein